VTGEGQRSVCVCLRGSAAKRERFEVEEKGMTSEVRREGGYAISARTSPNFFHGICLPKGRSPVLWENKHR